MTGTMLNYRITPCCFNCRYNDDIGIDEVDDYVCTWYWEHDEPRPDDFRTSPDGLCEYYEKEEHHGRSW